MEILIKLFFVISASYMILFGAFRLYRMNRPVDKFMRDESHRGLFESFEVKQNWSSQGQVFTRGMALKKEKKGYRLIKQAKLADSSILRD